MNDLQKVLKLKTQQKLRKTMNQRVSLSVHSLDQATLIVQSIGVFVNCFSL